LTVKREIEHPPTHDPFQFKRDISLVVVKFIISSLAPLVFIGGSISNVYWAQIVIKHMEVIVSFEWTIVHFPRLSDIVIFSGPFVASQRKTIRIGASSVVRERTHIRERRDRFYRSFFIAVIKIYDNEWLDCALRFSFFRLRGISRAKKLRAACSTCSRIDWWCRWCDWREGANFKLSLHVDEWKISMFRVTQQTGISSVYCFR